MIELHVPDFNTAKKFYGDLGFQIVWEREDKDDAKKYLVMKRQKSILNFYCGTNKVYDHTYFKKFPKTTPCGYAVELIIPITNIDTYYQKICRSYQKHIVKKLSQEHSHSDFRMVDPFGFYIRFVEEYNWVEERDKKGVQI